VAYRPVKISSTPVRRGGSRSLSTGPEYGKHLILSRANLQKDRTMPKSTSGGKTSVPQTPRQPRNEMSTLASHVAAGRVHPTPAQTRQLAATVLALDQTKGKR